MDSEIPGIVKKKRGRRPKNYTPISPDSLISTGNYQGNDLNFPTFVFYDECKKKYNCFISGFVEGREYNCFWDRHPIEDPFKPISCPINYEPPQKSKVYFSYISKTSYTIKSNSTKYPNNDNNCNLPCYITDGAFCSLECMLAMIEDNQDNPYYSKALFLFKKMLRDVFNLEDDKKKIQAAPHWRTLKPYGGKYTIKQFRSKLNFYNVDFCGTVEFKSKGYLYEEKIII